MSMNLETPPGWQTDSLTTDGAPAIALPRQDPWLECSGQFPLGRLLGKIIHTGRLQVQTPNGRIQALGVMPAEIIGGHPQTHPETQMHGGPPGNAHSEHIVIALFDEPSGTRIEDAQVEATISGIGHVAVTPMTLDPMLIAGVVTYGGYSTFSGRDTYTIDLRISRPGSQTITQISFVYDHSGT